MTTSELQRLAQLLVAITTELGEPFDTLFNDLPRLVREQRARITELEQQIESDRARAAVAVLNTELAALRLADPLKADMDKVRDFINQRPEYVQELKSADTKDDDYWRWSGGAEARRQLAERLGWTVPHKYGEKTAVSAGE